MSYTLSLILSIVFSAFIVSIIYTVKRCIKRINIERCTTVFKRSGLTPKDYRRFVTIVDSTYEGLKHRHPVSEMSIEQCCNIAIPLLMVSFEWLKGRKLDNKKIVDKIDGDEITEEDAFGMLIVSEVIYKHIIELNPKKLPSYNTYGSVMNEVRLRRKEFL